MFYTRACLWWVLEQFSLPPSLWLWSSCFCTGMYFHATTLLKMDCSSSCHDHEFSGACWNTFWFASVSNSSSVRSEAATRRFLLLQQATTGSRLFEYTLVIMSVEYLQQNYEKILKFNLALLQDLPNVKCIVIWKERTILSSALTLPYSFMLWLKSPTSVCSFTFRFPNT